MVVHWWGLTFKQQSNFLFLSEVWFVLGTPLWVRNPQSYAGKNVFLFIFTQIICTSDVISPPKYRQPRFLLYLDAFPQYGPVWFTLVVRGVWLELARLEICSYVTCMLEWDVFVSRLFCLVESLLKVLDLNSIFGLPAVYLYKVKVKSNLVAHTNNHLSNLDGDLCLKTFTYIQFSKKF